MSDESQIFYAALQQAIAALGIEIQPAQREQMFAHYSKVVEANREFNLTRITSPADAAVKHYADSLTLLKLPEFVSTKRLDVLDVGTGAGFPAVPLAIVCEAWSILAIDGTGKKARFVASVAEALKLKNLRVQQARGADLAREGGHKFDAVLLRAVTKLSEGLTEVAPLVRVGGSIVFYKTPQVETEIESAAPVAKELGLKAWAPFDLTLASADGPIERRLIRYERPHGRNSAATGF